MCPGNIRTPMLDLKEPSWLTPAIPVEKAAQCILRGITRNRKFIVFPIRWRFIWCAEPAEPGFAGPSRRVIVRRARHLKSHA